MITEILIFLLTFVLGYFLYVYKSIHYQFDKAGVKYLPGVPIFGNVWRSSLFRRHYVEDLDEVYRAYPDEKFVGFIEGTTKIIIIRDPGLIKTITVKDFDYFVDHKQFFPEELAPLFGGSVLMMKGDRWRDMRTTLSPAFTGSKMRQMMPFMTEISSNIVEYLKVNDTEVLDIGDVIRRYTNDVIASAGFGLQVNSLKDKDNEFYKAGQSLFKFTFLQNVYMVMMAMFPNFIKHFGIPLFPEKVTSFFRDMVSSTIEYREKNNVERPDMIHLLMQASKGTLKNSANITEKDNVGFATVQEELQLKGSNRQWTPDELTSQVFIFFVAGFESSATALVMCIHELAIHPEIQEKLYQEVKNFKNSKGNLTYDHINELKYVDCVINETMRKWAAAIFMDRLCTKEYELPPPREGGKSYRLKPGDVVYNMVNCLHMDPKYFPDPEKFDPERFSDDNKHKITPFTFMPFGMGPRNCIGSRFALLELKVLLYNLVLNFKILKCPKTTDPIRLEPHNFNIKAAGGTWIKLEARD